MSMYRGISWVVGKGCLLRPPCSFDKTLLAFALIHFVLQHQTCLLFRVTRDFLLLHSSPLWWKWHLFWVSVLEGVVGLHQFCSSVMSNSETPWTTARQASLSITNSWRLLKLMSIRLVMQSNHLIFCCPLLLLPSIFPTIRIFCNESVLHIRWPKYWSVSFNINPSSEYSGPISFRMDWLDLLAVQETLRSLLQTTVQVSFL